jgi:hypothetical protein
LFVFGVLPVTVFADSDAATVLEYTVLYGKATITGFTPPEGFDGNLEIPGTFGVAKCVKLQQVGRALLR